MPVSRRKRRSLANPSVGLQEGRAGRRRIKYDEQWNLSFKELLDYRSGHGDCNVPQSQGKLGTWVNHQRTAYMAGSLAQGRIDRLNSIGFKWTLASPTVPWETRFNELVQYKAKHGDCNVPRSQGKLGTWVSTQRSAYTAGSLAQDRIDRLNSIGFKWTLASPTVPWETRFDELIQHKAKHGDCKDRLDRLNDIGFDWTPPMLRPRKREALSSTQEQSLMRNESVSLLGTNVALGGDMPAGDVWDEAAVAEPARDDANAPAKAPSAVAPRKTPPTAAELPASATRKLVTVAGYGKPPATPIGLGPAHGAPWNPVRRRNETAAKEEERAPLIAKSMAPTMGPQWNVRFTELVNYRSEHGDCDVPQMQGKLGRWASKQRTSYIANSLAQDRIDQLSSIGFKWATRATKGKTGPSVPWEIRFDELIQHKAKHGDCNVPQRQGQLGRWVHHQSSAYTANSLAQDRVDRLNNIGFKWVLREVAP
ncbi:hypothetical protein THAOC_30961, partial [Thalassiosira oceanica]